MKVDKAVSTNDSDVSSAATIVYAGGCFSSKTIGYDAIFTTLVENKLLAIKRECAEKQRQKLRQRKNRPLGKILSAKKIFCVKRNTSSILDESDLGINNTENLKMCHAKTKKKTECSEREKVHHTPEDIELVSASGDIKDICDDSAEAVVGSPFVGGAGGCETASQTNLSFCDMYVSEDSLKTSRKNSTSTETTFSYARPLGLSIGSTRLKEHELHRLKVLSAKSISAQCSPIFNRPLRSCISGHSAPMRLPPTQLPLKLPLAALPMPS